MQILIPVSSKSPFFPEAEFYFPKPLIEVAGMPMIEIVVRQLKNSVPDGEFIFVIDKNDVGRFSLDRTVKLAGGPLSKVVERMGETSGALCSCLLAIDELDPDAPLLISNSDQIVVGNWSAHIAKFDKSGANAGVLTFDSVHPRWSYIVDAGNHRVAQAVEKKVVSRNAVAGLYWFRTAGQFIEAAKRVILHDAHADGLFFISASINEIILMGGNAMFAPIDSRDFHSFYAPARIEQFERSGLAAGIRQAPRSVSQVNVIIPAAGEGSRFAKEGWKKPKPFIDVEGVPMLRHVIRNVAPAGAGVTALLRRAHMDEVPAMIAGLEQSGTEVVPVDRLTDGTACTVLLARRVFDNDKPMMVANSDQLVDFNVEDFLWDCIDRHLDGSILVFRDPAKNTKWSFARLGQNGLVAEVAEKRPISDLATVGIYLFSRGHDFVSAAVDMIACNDRVNNEFYTCPVYNYMIKNGAKIGVYEIPMAAMHGLGTPEDLKTYLARRGAASSADAPD